VLFQRSSRVQTPSRLHFGLLSLASFDTVWPGRDGGPGVPARRFGGAGLIIDSPGVVLDATPAASWSAEGPLADRALAFARRFAESLTAGAGRQPLSPHRIRVERAAPEHAGLGTGTQLGLAVAATLARSAGLDLSAAELARRVGRGLRSGLGVHGFARGGFLVDGGKRDGPGLASLVAHAPFPEDWRVVVVLPGDNPAPHGPAEHAAFARLVDRPAETDALCRLVLLGMLPALAERDFPAFGAALHDFNARAGGLFAAAQGGTYAGPHVAAAVAFLRGAGVRGVGQSSWGPAVFAVVGDPEEAEALARRTAAHLGLPAGRAFVARGSPGGAFFSPQRHKGHEEDKEQ
jgi:beta-RFAP synthase